MAKKTVHKLKIDYLRYPDKGIAFLGDEEIIVKHGLPGQVVEVECSRRRKQKIGNILQVLEHAQEEAAGYSCTEFGACGGCSFLNIPYSYELELKKGMVERLLKDYWNGAFPDVVPAPSPANYRNKMEFSFGDQGQGLGKDSELALGIRKRNRYYEVAIPKDCALITADFKAILLATLEYFRQTTETFYHKMRHTGTLRYLVLRRGEFTGEVLVNLVTTGISQNHLENWKAALLKLPLEGNITGILHTTSTALADAVVPDKLQTLWGRSHFYENICGLTFGISPFSFFQTYSGGAELLYRTISEFACRHGQDFDISDKVYDLYCGTGTIAQILAPYAKEVVGIELVPEAVQAAKENARKNSIDNCRFIAGDVLKTINENDFASPDVLVLDPPRDGIHPKALGKLIAFGAQKIIYVSCKPTSLARDLATFREGGYHVTDLRIHDMFPRTPHVETVVLLQKI